MAFFLLAPSLTPLHSPESSMVKTRDIFTVLGTADRIMNYIAIAVLVALCLSPLPTMWRIWKKKSTEEFHPYPYMAAALNCIVWFAYSFPFEPLPMPSRSYYLFVSTSVWGGFFCSYSMIFSMYTTSRNRSIMSLYGPIGLVLLFTIGFSWKSWSETTSNRVSFAIMMRSRLTGPLGVVFGIIMYASPLSIIKYVYETNNVQYLLYWPCFAYFLYGLFWCIYAFLPPGFDPYIAITNGAGALLGLLQLGLYYKFRVRYEDSSYQKKREKI